VWPVRKYGGARPPGPASAAPDGHYTDSAGGSQLFAERAIANMHLKSSMLPHKVELTLVYMSHDANVKAPLVLRDSDSAPGVPGLHNSMTSSCQPTPDQAPGP